MLLDIRIDTDFTRINNFKENQLPYAMKLGLNAVGEAFQEAQRGGIARRFKLRRKDWNLRGVYIANQDRPQKGVWRIIVRIQANRNYLDKFEAGTGEAGYHLPHKGRFVWVPSTQAFGNKVIQAGNPLHPGNLTFKRAANGTLQGNERTFLLKMPKGPMVFQRVARDLSAYTLRNIATGMGPHKRSKRTFNRSASTVRLLYTLKPRVAVETKLDFTATAIRVVRAHWAPLMRRAMERAMKGAK